MLSVTLKPKAIALRALFFGIGLSLGLGALAHAEQTDRGVGIYLDQDLFVPGYNEDRDYTMGAAIEFFWDKEDGMYPLDGLVREAATWLEMRENAQDKIVYSFMLGTLAFTPNDLATSAPVVNDRPYASLIYLSNKRVLADAEKALSAEVLLGLMGTNFSRDVQTSIHRTYRSIAGGSEPVDPMGWSNQISNGGELTMRIRLANSRLQANFSRPGVWDVTSTLGASLGFQTNASVSVAARLGAIKSPFWTLPYDPVNRGNFLPGKAANEWYFWTALRAHLVGYDALLQGQFRHSEVAYSADQIERLVYDGALGFTWGFGHSQLTVSVNAKSPDIKVLKRNQAWGSLNYIYHF
jgi:hypothetical protein